MENKDLMKEVYEKVKYEWGMSEEEIKICLQGKERIGMSSMGIDINSYLSSNTQNS